MTRETLTITTSHAPSLLIAGSSSTADPASSHAEHAGARYISPSIGPSDRGPLAPRSVCVRTSRAASNASEAAMQATPT